jgi:hypothetical protein
MHYIALSIMPYKRSFIVLVTLFCTLNCVAQEVIEKKNKLNDHLTEKFYVSKADEQVKSGPYQVFFNRKTLVAEGTYLNGKKVGIWNFYGLRGNLLQRYNYNKDSLEYEARERLPSDFHYLVDKKITDSDRVTKPLRIGGRYFGFLPYLNVFKTPLPTYNGDEEMFVGEVELLISPLGRLAGYKVHLIAPYLEYDQTINLSLSLFKEEQKQFIPATFNHQPVLSRIVIKCRVTDDGGLDFY